MTSTKRWIKINGTFEDVLPNTDNYMKPYDYCNHIYATNKRLQLTKYRPTHQMRGHKKVRICKDITYLNVILNQMRQEKISGPYIGLAAAYSAEIYSAFADRIKGDFINCQMDPKSYKALKVFHPLVKEAYRTRNVNFILCNNNINYEMLNYQNKFAFYDLDYMCGLNKPFINEIAEGVAHSSKNKCTIAVWHTRSRLKGTTNDQIHKEYRPYLLKKLRQSFYVLRKDHVKYLEIQPGKTTGMTMFVDIFTLQRRKLWKKAA